MAILVFFSFAFVAVCFEDIIVMHAPTPTTHFTLPEWCDAATCIALSLSFYIYGVVTTLGSEGGRFSCEKKRYIENDALFFLFFLCYLDVWKKKAMNIC